MTSTERRYLPDVKGTTSQPGKRLFPVTKSEAATWIQPSGTVMPISHVAEPVPNPSAGVEELKWLESNKEYLSRRFPNHWVAILGGQVVVSAATFDEVFDYLDRNDITDALIEEIPSDPTKWDYLIA